ncbi:MAG: hypothetical protein DRG24_05220 [Epsilonproteobacteria bacterium]|nr:MAG: hypothetical protein DRG24_05220 [Campylobacterota bacterium]
MYDFKKLYQHTKDLNILYVEDDQNLQQEMENILEDFFATVTLARDGEDGLQKYLDSTLQGHRKFDLILSDIRMPRLNGLKMIEKIRALDKNIIILIFSAHGESDYFVESIKLGVDGYLLKPFDLNQFISVLNSSVKKIQLKNEIKKNMLLKERVDLALSGNNDAVWDWNLLDDSIYFSPRFKEMLGYEDHELSNDLSTWKERIHPDDITNVMLTVQKNIDGETEYYDKTYRLKHKNGSWIWILDRGKTLYDQTHKAIRMIGTHTDITLEKEKALKFTHQAQIIEQIHDSVISTDLNGIITSWNEGSEYLLGYKAQEVIGKHISIIYLQETKSLLKKNIDILMQTGEHHSEAQLVTKSKSLLFAEHSLSLLKNEQGESVGFVCYSQDITERKNAQDALQKQHAYLQSIIDGVEEPIMVIKDDYSIELMNTAFTENITTKSITDPEHPKCYEVAYNRSVPCAGEDYPCPLKKVMSTTERETVIHTHTDTDGHRRYFELSASPLFDDANSCNGIIEVVRDITGHVEVQDDLREQKEILNYQAHHDALTELPNRALFHDRLKQAIEKARRHQKEFALFFIDLDRFKQINDSLGHKVGDGVLKVVADRLNSLIRNEDTLARLGGDEFTVLMEGLKRPQDASILAQKILEILVKPIHIGEHILYISSSIGISLYPKDDTDAQNLLKYADTAMYKAKKEGRDNYQFYSAEMTAIVFEHVVMQARLRQALDREEFIVYYQLQVNGEDNSITGVEALIRWLHPEMGLVPPAKFIPIAEETGLIIALDRWVMQTAVQQMAHWYEQGLLPGVLALNLAIKQLQQEDFITVLSDTLETAGLKPEYLELEVTEAQIMTHPDQAITVLKKISALGIELAVDDFGTGYSSLSYLKRLPIDRLKIDQSFVRDLPDSEEDVGIAKAVIALSQSLNLKVIAEGVETREQKQFLIENGCPNMQGYLYGKPMPAEEVEKMFKDVILL